MYQFIRSYNLQINDRANGLLFTVKDLRITFEITKNVDNKAKSNEAVLAIYNLSETTIAKLSTRELACQVILDVGYENNNKRLLLADVQEIKTEKKRGEIVTTFKMGEGFLLLNEAKISKTYAEDVSLKDVVLDTLGIMGCGVGFISDVLDTKKFPYGYSSMGTPKQILDEVCKAQELEWNIDGNKVNIKEKRGVIPPTKTEDIIVLSKETGLIDIPFSHSETISQAYDESAPNELQDNEIDVTAPLKETKDGKPRKQTRQKIRRKNVQLKALLNPECKPNSLVRLITTATELSGLYRVRNIKYSGDSRGGEWYMTIYADNVKDI